MKTIFFITECERTPRTRKPCALSPQRGLGVKRAVRIHERGRAVQDPAGPEPIEINPVEIELYPSQAEARTDRRRRSDHIQQALKSCVPY